MATVDLGKISFTQKGTWNSGTAYVAKDIVQYTDDNETSSYVAVASSTNQAPATNGTVNTTYWALFAKGASIASNYQSSAWAGGTSYQKGDVVQYTDSGTVSTYLAIADSTGETPSTSGAINSSYWAYLAKGTASAGTAWDSTPKTANFTAVAGNGYWLDSSGGSFTITLPAGNNGDTIEFSDIGNSLLTNNITLTPNGSEKIDGATGSRFIGVNRQGIRLVYSTATNGWTSPTGNYNDTTPWYILPYNMQYVAVAGGGSGGKSNAGGGGAGGMLEASSVQLVGGSLLTISIGAGGASQDSSFAGITGNNTTISGAGINTVTANGGGGGNSLPGGSGGGAKYDSSTGGSGTSGQGNNGGGAGTAAPQYGAGGGGGKGSAGSNGTSNSGGAGGSGGTTTITGSSITLAGGGGGSVDLSNGSAGSGGSGGGGNGSRDSRSGIDATANTGGGGGGTHAAPTPGSGAGGSGVVYIRVPTANYTGVTTGSPTVTTDGTDTIMKFTASGTYET